jgi:hypothetical protein
MSFLTKLLHCAVDGELPYCVGVDKAFVSWLPWLHLV